MFELTHQTFRVRLRAPPNRDGVLLFSCFFFLSLHISVVYFAASNAFESIVLASPKIAWCLTTEDSLVLTSPSLINKN